MDRAAAGARHSMPADKPELSFNALVLSLATTAGVHFGDVPDPATGKTSPPNLEGASQMIDLLSLLAEKTKGNLAPDEQLFLEQVLFELRMRYVEASGGHRAEP